MFNDSCVVGIRAHPDFEDPSVSTGAPAILRLVSDRVRTQRGLSKACPSTDSSSREPGSSRGLSRSGGISSADDDLPGPTNPVESETDALQEALLENTGLSSSFVTRVQVATPSGEYASDKLTVICA